MNKNTKTFLVILPFLFFFVSMPPQSKIKQQKAPETKEEKVLVSQINSLEKEIYLLDKTKFTSPAKENKKKLLEDSVKVLKNNLEKLQEKGKGL